MLWPWSSFLKGQSRWRWRGR